MLGNEGKSKIGDVIYDPLTLGLSRLATRIDIQLESNEDLTADFKGRNIRKDPLLKYRYYPARIPPLPERHHPAIHRGARLFSTDSTHH